VLADREFHSVQLGKWLETKNVDFALRQKKGTCFLDDQAISTPLKDLDIKPGMSQFYEQIIWTQSHQVKGFNLAIYWRRKYRKKVQKELPTQPELIPAGMRQCIPHLGIFSLLSKLKN